MGTGRERTGDARPVRVLVVDGSATMRKAIATALDAEGGFEVAGTAPSASLALRRIAQLRPEVVTVDPALPERGAVEMVSEIRRQYPAMRVVLCGPAGDEGLSAAGLRPDGAVERPGAELPIDEMIGALRASLGGRLRTMLRREAAPGETAAGVGEVRASSAEAGRPPQRPRIVTIGLSTGGPNALNAVLPALPAGFPLPILVVQHMPAQFTGLLAERLDGICALRVKEAETGDLLVPGRILLAPGNFHLGLKRDGAMIRVALEQSPPENSCRPAVDVTLRYVAEVYGGASLTVILTGMGRDGYRGVEVLRRQGGQVIVQDEATSVVWGMPGFIAKAGLADAQCPLDRVAAEIEARLLRGERA